MEFVGKRIICWIVNDTTKNNLDKKKYKLFKSWIMLKHFIAKDPDKYIIQKSYLDI